VDQLFTNGGKLNRPIQSKIIECIKKGHLEIINEEMNLYQELLQQHIIRDKGNMEVYSYTY
jgi:hypothetical protein